MASMSEDLRQTKLADAHLVQSTEAMLDYAIIAGAELKNPVFVRLLRLARRSLLGDDQPAPDQVVPDGGEGP
jgi:hypothetical protein